MKKTIAIGYDLSTTALSVVGITEDGKLVFFSVPMRGATRWHGEPAHDLAQLPGLSLEALQGLLAQGFEFAPNGVISGSVRQHDMVLADSVGNPLEPALSWQCNAATKQVKSLKASGAEAIVGQLEPRLVLPKLLWALEQQPDLASEIGTVYTTGDYIAKELTGALTLSSSEGLSNGLLNQKTRKFVRDFIASVPGLNTAWFPPVVQSGQLIPLCPGLDGDFYRRYEWNPVRALLPGWRVVAGLGDNHAGAVGGGLNDYNTIVVSAGTSGTVVRKVKLGTATAGQAMMFEYYRLDTLLLMMFGDCASWYGRFFEKYGGGKSHAELDALALKSAVTCLLPPPESAPTPFPHWFTKLTLGEKARAVQSSIANYLGLRFKRMLDEVSVGGQIKRVIMTGGLTASPCFCRDLAKQTREFGFQGQIRVSSRTGPLANQAATLGALINAMVGGGLYPSLEAAVKELCPTREL